MIFCTLNGINRSAIDTTDRMATSLIKRGHEVHTLTYDVTRAWNSRDRRKQMLDASFLLEQVASVKRHHGKVPHIVAHSHGCLLASRIMELAGSFPFEDAYLFAAAMDRDWIWPEYGASRIVVISNRRDRAVWWARLMPLEHPWGALGRLGHKNGHRIPTVTQWWDETQAYPRSHSHYFKPENIDRWADAICKFSDH